jgi:hypothetical protein
VWWWYTPIIPALRRQEDYEFQTSLGYIEGPCLKTTTTTATATTTTTTTKNPSGEAMLKGKKRDYKTCNSNSFKFIHKYIIYSHIVLLN